MKTRSLFAVLLIAALLLAACGTDAPAPAGASVSDIMENAVQTEGSAAPAPEPDPDVPAQTTVPKAKSDVHYDAVDEDLTVLSGTVAYAKVLEMNGAPDQYLGKVVRISGLFLPSEGNGRMYYACVLYDATACCSQGFEFLLSGDYRFPDDYPKQNEVITVTGVFDTYYEGSTRYVQLIDAVME